MNDIPTARGVRAPVALLAALGALLVGLAGGGALGGMLGYVAGQRAAGGKVVVPPAIERLGLAPQADDGDAGDAGKAPEDGLDSSDRSDRPDGSAASGAPSGSDAGEPTPEGRSKGGRQASDARVRPRLGVEVATEPLAVDDYAAGARVMAVAPGSAAAAAGILEGDVIVAVDGAAVRTSDELAAEIEAHDAGDEVALVVLRGAAELEIAATLGAAQP